MKVFLITAVFVLLAVTACGSREVTRTETDTVTDLSGYWNDTDARIVADSIVDQCLHGRWFDVRTDRSDGRVAEVPVIVVGGVRNQSTEHINVDVFMSEIERSLLNSGEFLIAAGGAERDEVRGERRDQTIFASPSTAAEFGREVGADYVMTGTVNSIEDQADDTRAIFYQVNIELIDVETALKVWMGSTEIKKVIEW
ncbi:MAG: penicillin-binding protein activator LpoB [Candidatus Sabulitectum sp.]|nr:penicillin-binding protein activator LpoB [Candidatus Sabulitectum sp.]